MLPKCPQPEVPTSKGREGLNMAGGGQQQLPVGWIGSTLLAHGPPGYASLVGSGRDHMEIIDLADESDTDKDGLPTMRRSETTTTKPVWSPLWATAVPSPVHTGHVAVQQPMCGVPGTVPGIIHVNDSPAGLPDEHPVGNTACKAAAMPLPRGSSAGQDEGRALHLLGSPEGQQLPQAPVTSVLPPVDTSAPQASSKGQAAAVPTAADVLPPVDTSAPQASSKGQAAAVPTAANLLPPVDTSAPQASSKGQAAAAASTAADLPAAPLGVIDGGRPPSQASSGRQAAAPIAADLPGTPLGVMDHGMPTSQASSEGQAAAPTAAGLPVAPPGVIDGGRPAAQASSGRQAAAPTAADLPGTPSGVMTRGMPTSQASSEGQAAAPTAADLSGTPLGFIDRSNQQAAGCRAMGIVAPQGAAGTLGISASPRQSQGDRDEGKAEQAREAFGSFLQATSAAFANYLSRS